MNKKPVNGMRDILPREMEIRDYVISVITKTYKAYGFRRMETPCVESVENLLGKNGGENEKLIFKILKRGEKLNLSEASKEDDLVDSGLRYDLTMPLSRYYSCHEAELTKPFKALQIGPVFRAERPQKGRYREFYQCDIDILGDPTNLCEIELILATSEALTRIGFRGFQIRINDRRLLKDIASLSGLPEEKNEELFIALDKLDKIGEAGVKEELLNMGISESMADSYMNFIMNLNEKNTEDAFLFLAEKLPDSRETIENLKTIFSTVNANKTPNYELVFDPTLVRGMGYYTGPIFEIRSPEFQSSIGGGGRYDEMIGKFAGTKTPACGFSIGFERIISILTDTGFTIPLKEEKIAFLLEKGLSETHVTEAIKEAERLREEGKIVRIDRMAKNKKFQKEQLEADGFTQIREFYENPIGEKKS